MACMRCGKDRMEGNVRMVEEKVRYGWTRRFFEYFEENLQNF